MPTKLEFEPPLGGAEKLNAKVDAQQLVILAVARMIGAHGSIDGTLRSQLETLQGSEVRSDQATAEALASLLGALDADAIRH